MSDPISKLISTIPPDPVREELVSYLEEIKTLSCITLPAQNAAPLNIMTPLLKLGNFFLKSFRKTNLISTAPLPINICLSVVTGVLSFMLSNDSLEFKEFKNILDVQFTNKCEATRGMYKTCILYMQGLPTSQNLDTPNKHLHLSRLASDCPINTGVDVLQYLAVEIKELSVNDDFDNFTQLMKKTIVYCCLSVCHELFLLSRYAKEKSYGLDGNSVMNVIEGDRRNDANLLRFLYKPKQSMTMNFLNYIHKKEDWHVVTEFLQRRDLEIQSTGFDGKTVKIWSAHYDNACLSHHNLILTTCIRCHYRTPGEEEANSSFLFNAVEGALNEYKIAPKNKPCKFVYFRHWVHCNKHPPTGTDSWRIVEVEAENSEESLFLLLIGGHVPGKCAIYTDVSGMVDLQSPSKANPACFWKLSIEA